MYVKKARRVYRKRAPRQLRRKISKPRVGLAVKKYVKRAIHANVENKKASYTTFQSFGSFANSSTLYARPLTPATSGSLSIQQGLGQGDRIANKIKIMRAMFRYVINPLPYDIGSNAFPTPTEVMIIFGFTKGQPSVTPNSSFVAQIFQSGSTALAPTGTLPDLIQPFNTDVFTIKKVIRHKIGNSAVEGTGGQANRAYFANNDFKYNAVRSVNITNIYPKSLQWTDNGTVPQNAGLFLMFQAVNADGTVMAASTISTRINYTIDLTYEDA